MKKLFFAVAVLLIAGACSSDENSVSQANVQETQETEVIPDRVLTMEINGMVCKMGCGSSIRKELTSIEGVSSVEFDYEDDRQTNMAFVSFDKDMTNADDIVKAVTTVNNGQFTVGKTSSESLDTKHVEHSVNTTEKESTMDVSSTSIEIPNLLDLLSEIIL